MKITCPHCNQNYDVDKTSIGKEADCTNCGSHFVIQATVAKPQKAVTLNHCPYCGGEIVSGMKKCRHCGEWIASKYHPRDPVAYIILAFFFGSLALHNFYAGEKERIGIKLIVLFVSIFLICPLLQHFLPGINGEVIFLICAFGFNEIISWFDIVTCHNRLFAIPSDGAARKK